MNPIFFLIMCLMAQTATATTANVTGADVDAQVGEFEARFGFDHDDVQTDQYDQRFHLDYGLTDTWGVRFVTRQRQSEGDSLEYAGTDAEIKYQMFEDQINGFDGGFKLVYALADGDKKPDKLSLFWLYDRQIHDWKFRNNIILYQQVGSNHHNGPGLETRWQIKHPLSPFHALGIEMFNIFGEFNTWHGYDEQSHRIGPVFTGKLTDRLSYQTGMEFGISQNAPDLDFKFFLSHSF